MRGSCLCGAVVYEVEGLGPVVHCHCRTCRKAHGASFTSTARVERENFRWLSGVEQLRSFASSPGKLRHFCGQCGSHLLAEWTAEPEVIVRVATLDDDPGIRPLAHIWTSHDVAWLSDSEQTRVFAEKPPHR